AAGAASGRWPVSAHIARQKVKDGSTRWRVRWWEKGRLQSKTFVKRYDAEMFARKVGVIKVGAPTENEVNALKYKVEDCINATHSAFKSGVVAGGGIALAEIKTSSEILNAALQVPFRQLKNNVGLDDHRPLKVGEAINVVTGEIGPWQKVGVMDPVDVLIAQVESAISIASLLATTSGMIVEEPKHLKQEQE
ncbi:MAG: 60 kDa chaperonin, partial [Parcubacteria group bacterium GW2011_GWA2_48_9]